MSLPAGEVTMGALEGETVLIAVRLFSERASVVLALAWQSGQERWRYQL